MFCYQCEQTAQGKGCVGPVGVCGKNEDLAALQDLLIFGLKGIAAYAYHARELGAHDPEVDAFMHEALFTTLTNVDFDLDHHLQMVLKAGEMNLKIMELLDKAHTEKFGNPVPTKVYTGIKKGPAILVTGHDLLDLYELLKQTEGTGINVYTHGEMLPAHAYPELKKFPHLVGNYGTAWQNQKKEFEEFPGVILATTNCVLIPKDSYKDRMFTCGVAHLPGVKHIANRDFSEVIKKALELPPAEEKEGGYITTGFHHTAVLSLADTIIEGVKSGKIKHFFLIGGCDGAKTTRNYYNEIADKVPKDSIILTLACGKYRFIHKDFGEIEGTGIPRLLDIGQCNNSYSAVKIALALAEAFKVGVNDLPLSLILSWFEQKAVAILLSLLYLGVKNIRIGPTAPAFLTPNLLAILNEKFGLKLITTPDEDLKAILG
ncbi:hydroxylamine reductase [Carboxydothermus hydrogenoformans]|uniref:Hydroxylamine reductase n=1 Tax=Carboxydothermus hydrogenoformans (strain ATCC BAA-161 / DSM 6008 / Z-2901) TaxID=246194 RepID=Q3AB48_CARHZ|nr:hydroxylamine reductase [Carboxydothermus hydrogenoformans]ABB15179.1 hybrid cluster protein [Carboxydothermus hydrogenoformans Z-2901]